MLGKFYYKISNVVETALTTWNHSFVVMVLDYLLTGKQYSNLSDYMNQDVNKQEKKGENDQKEEDDEEENEYLNSEDNKKLKNPKPTEYLIFIILRVPFFNLMKDCFGNYVAQRIFNLGDEGVKNRIHQYLLTLEEEDIDYNNYSNNSNKLL